MRDLRRRARLLEKATRDLRCRRVLGAQELERDFAIETGVVRGEHVAIAALTELSPEAVLADL
jgi:hypothetical protein